MTLLDDTNVPNQRLLIERGLIHQVTERTTEEGRRTEIIVADSSLRLWEEHAVTASIEELCSSLDCTKLD